MLDCCENKRFQLMTKKKFSLLKSSLGLQTVQLGESNAVLDQILCETLTGGSSRDIVLHATAHSQIIFTFLSRNIKIHNQKRMMFQRSWRMRPHYI